MNGEFKAPQVGVGAVVWKGDRLLLVRRGHPPRKGAWSLPGGRQQWGETVHEGVVREVREETGVEIRILDTVAVVDLIERDGAAIAYHYTVVDVVAEWTAGDAVAGDDAAEVTWAHPDDLGRYQLTPKMLEVIAIAARKRKRPG
jgi:ADP-ribose pyrophosphatase YjhB (NUDIX family)